MMSHFCWMSWRCRHLFEVFWYFIQVVECFSSRPIFHCWGYIWTPDPEQASPLSTKPSTILCSNKLTHTVIPPSSKKKKHNKKTLITPTQAQLFSNQLSLLKDLELTGRATYLEIPAVCPHTCRPKLMLVQSEFSTSSGGGTAPPSLTSSCHAAPVHPQLSHEKASNLNCASWDAIPHA